MKLLLDMNLPPALAVWLTSRGFPAVHWSTVGDARAADREILLWARENDHVLVSHDLDFSAILAATDADAPSVIQVRTHDLDVDHSGPLLVAVATQERELLETGRPRFPRRRNIPRTSASVETLIRSQPALNASQGARNL